MSWPACCTSTGFASSNRGLRAYFFGLAALAWFIQPWALVLASSWVVGVLYWRDSRSATLATLAGPVTEKGLPRGEGGRHTTQTGWIPGQARNDEPKLVRAFGDERPGEARLMKV